MTTFIRSRTTAKPNHYEPIIEKAELDAIQPDDPRHYQMISAPDGSQSNALSFNPRQ
jgi:hypothetical protein